MDLSSVTSFFTNISIDWIFLVSVALLAFLDAMRSSTARAAALGLSFPLTYIIAQAAPAAQLIGDVQKQFSSSLAHGLFAAIILIVFFLLLYRITDSFAADGGFLQSLAGAIGLAIMIGVFWPLIPAFTALHEPSVQILQVFGEAYRFWWILVGLAALSFSRG